MTMKTVLLTGFEPFNGETINPAWEAVRALDRALISGCYVVPLFYLPRQWVARWTYIEHPARTSLFGYLPETWWHQPTRALQ